MGQANIHKKIMSLKFQDCHAKIRQVDSQPTVADAVVVQVTGELSNNRQQMRRFMQTFVLVPQSPKKYYVHNDVFRYQDEVFHDQDGGVDSAVLSQQQPPAQQDSNDELQQECEVEEPIQEPTAPAQQQEPAFYDTPQQQSAPLSNGTGATQGEDVSEAPEEPPSEEANADEEPATPAAPPEVAEEKEEAQPEQTPTPEVAPQPQEPQKPVSWAALASQKPSHQSNLPAPQQQPQQTPRPVVAVPKPAAGDATAKVPSETKPQSQRAPRPPRNERIPRDSARNAPSDNQDNQQQRSGGQQQKYSDAHQLFVGNLPHNIVEQELQEFFEKECGKVIEVRINRKSSSGRDNHIPNFGFVVFENTESVQTALANRPFNLRPDVRLNVEEKKQRNERPGSGNRMVNRGGNQVMPSNRGGQGNMGPRGTGRSGPGGPPRGGAGGNRGGNFPGRR